MILFVITSNNILLSLPNALTYYLIPDNSFFKYTKLYLPIIRNRFFFIALLKHTSPLLYY